MPLTRYHSGGVCTNRISPHKWISSWLSERYCAGCSSLRSGPGWVLGPVIFLIFINDLTQKIRLSVFLFGDDCVMYKNIKSPMDCQILQDDMNSLEQLESDCQMKFNVAKCHSMRMTRHPIDKQKRVDYSFHQQTWNRFSTPNTLE